MLWPTATFCDRIDLLVVRRRVDVSLRNSIGKTFLACDKNLLRFARLEEIFRIYL